MAWDAALKMTKVKLELFTNVVRYTFIERYKRGVSQISKRNAKANNNQSSKADYTLNLFKCKQFVWMGYVPMLTYKRI